MSNLAVNQTEANSWFIITNSSLYSSMNTIIIALGREVTNTVFCRVWNELLVLQLQDSCGVRK